MDLNHQRDGSKPPKLNHHRDGSKPSKATIIITSRLQKVRAKWTSFVSYKPITIIWMSITIIPSNWIGSIEVSENQQLYICVCSICFDPFFRGIFVLIWSYCIILYIYLSLPLSLCLSLCDLAGSGAIIGVVIYLSRGLPGFRVWWYLSSPFFKPASQFPTQEIIYGGISLLP